MRNHEVPEGWYSRLIKHAVRETYYDFQDYSDWDKRQADMLNEILEDWDKLGDQGFRIHFMVGDPKAKHDVEHESRFLPWKNLDTAVDFRTRQDWRLYHDIVLEDIEATWSLLGYRNPIRVHVITGDNVPLKERPGYEHR